MAIYTYTKIINASKICTKNVNSKHDTGISNKWCYYFSKALISPNKDIKTISIEDTGKLDGDYLSRQISKADIIAGAKKVIKFVESKKKLPYGVTWGKYKINTKLFTYILASTLIYYDKNKKLPATRNVNSKVFTEPTETGNKVYDDFVKKTGKKFTTLDDLLGYVKAHGRYIFEFDDVRSNTQVTACMCGNCTDWLQWLWNMAKAMGYDVKCIHVKCRTSGTGHVFGKFRHSKNTGGNWITRDPASVANGGAITSVWCSDGYVQAVNPDWFLENLNR